MTVEGFVNGYRAYFQPIVTFLGFIGNTLVIIVFSKKRLSRYNIYSISVVIAHSLALFFNSFLDDFLGRGLYYATSGRVYVKIDTISQALCVLMTYQSTVMYFSSGFLMVVFSVDRFLVLRWPFKFKGDNNVKKSVIICLIVYGWGYVTGIPLALSYKLIPSHSKNAIGNYTCHISGSDSALAAMALYYESIVVFVIPTILILIVNIGIIYQITRISRTRSSIVIDKQANHLETARIIGMIATSTTFLFFSIPLSVVIIIRLQYRDEHIPNIISWSRLFDSMKDINYAINFFIYILFLSYFKYDLKGIFVSSYVYQFLSTAKNNDIQMKVNSTDETNDEKDQIC